ncbi:MAG TPA: 2'-5' RNA ligase family protein [Sediminibacterium sp.]
MPSEILSGYATAEYRLVIEPPEVLREELLRLKKYFSETYDCAAAALGKPQITLLRFEQYEMIEKRIIHRLQLLVAAQDAFLVEMDGFSSFPTHTICFQLTTQEAAKALVKSIRPIQHLLKIDKERKPHFITEPYITLAASLLPWQYEKGWLEMSNTHFSGKFMAEELVLLRKREGEKRYETVQRFVMKNEKTVTVQGALF